jgi:hypothetical protein
VNQEQTTRRTDIVIDSNWIVTIGLALLFAFTAFLLIWSIRDLLFDKVDHQLSPILVVGVVYYFLFAYSFPSKPLKVAFSLLGVDLTARMALAYLHGSASTQHSAAIAGSVARQIAYTIILFAIAQWFRSVVRRAPARNRGIAD